MGISATIGDRAAMLVGEVSIKIINQFRIYGLAPQQQQDFNGILRREIAIPLRNPEQKQTFRVACSNLRIVIN